VFCDTTVEGAEAGLFGLALGCTTSAAGVEDPHPIFSSAELSTAQRRESHTESACSKQ
jgi:hypothetical protein